MLHNKYQEWKKGKILSDYQLKMLMEHKYSSSGSTILDPVMQRFWNWFVLQIPTTIAPNLLTILGLTVNAVTALILMLCCPDARSSPSGWTLLLFAIGLFIYQTLDAIDGKQARRTGTSSPLGELFDHGCDSLSTVFVALATVIAIQLGDYPNLMFYQCMAASTLFYTAHWHTYVSGTLSFGRFDVTEAQFTIMFIHLFSAIFGSDVWSSKIPLGFTSVELKVLLTLATLLGSLSNMAWFLSCIFCPSRDLKQNGCTIAGTSIVSPLYPIAVVITAGIVIMMKSPTSLYEHHPCLYLLTFGFIVAKVTNRLVVSVVSQLLFFFSVILFAF